MDSKTIAIHPTITVGQIPEVLNIFKGHHNVFFLSQPGIGKTVAVSKWAKDIKAELIVEVASLLDRLDLAGLPHIEQYGELANVSRVTVFAPNSKMAKLSKEHNPDGDDVVVYFNEFNAAPDSVYPVLYRLLNERAIGNLHIRDNVVFVADGNPAQSQSAGRQMQEALKRRFAMFLVETNFPAWALWANASGIDGRIVSFLNYNQQHLNDFDPTKRNRLTYACPASWEKLSNVLERILAIPSPEVQNASFAATVGSEAGAQFAAYVSNMSRLPDMEEMLANPERCDIPKEADTLSLTIGCIYNLASRDEKKVIPALTIGLRLLDTSAEWGAYMFRSFAQNPSIWKNVVRTKFFTEKVMPCITKKKALMDAIFAAAKCRN
jgi:hypothetical protein